MELMREAIGLAPRVYRQDERLRELTFGDWEGLTWKEIRDRDPEGARAREADKWAFAPPGGESYAVLAERVRPFLGELRRDSVVVSHGGVARVMRVLIACSASARLNQLRASIATGLRLCVSRPRSSSNHPETFTITVLPRTLPSRHVSAPML